MAEGIVTALCHRRVDRPPISSLTVGGVLREFLTSNVFLEMANLHEALLTCTLTHEQLLLPKWYVYVGIQCLYRDTEAFGFMMMRLAHNVDYSKQFMAFKKCLCGLVIQVCIHHRLD